MAAAVGLGAEEFADPARGLATLRRRLAAVDPETAVVFFILLSTFLVDDKKQDWVAAVHELDVGLHPGDYDDRERVAGRLRERTQALSPGLGFLYGIRLANVLGLAERAKDQLAALEAHLGLRPEDYRDRARLGSILAVRPAEVSPAFWAMGIQMLAANLGKSGRRAESVAVLAAALGLSASDSTDPEALQARIVTALGAPEWLDGMGLNYLSLLSSQQRELGRAAESLSLYEADLGVSSADYRDLPRLGARLRAWRTDLPPELATFSRVQLLSALNGAQRHENGLAALGADLGVDLARTDAQSLVARLRVRCEALPGNIAGLYLGMAACTLSAAGRPLEAAAVLAADSDLAAIDWRDAAALARRLEDRLGDLAALTRLLYVSSLSSALHIAGREEEAALLVDAYLRVVSPIGEEPPDFALTTVSCHLYTGWLSWWGRDVERKPLEICRNLVPCLRQTLAEQGVVLADRERFIRDVSDLRHAIVQTGLYWAEQETDPGLAGELRRTAFLWDLELSQRLLVERLLLTEIHPMPAGEPPPSGLWPLSEGPPPEEGHLPGSGEAAAFLGILDAR
jgi:hypothetical protein